MAIIKKAQSGAKVSSETMTLRKKYAAKAQQERNNNAANAKNEIKQNAAKADSLRKVYAKKAKMSVKSPKYKPALKKGGVVKKKK